MELVYMLLLYYLIIMNNVINVFSSLCCGVSFVLFAVCGLCVLYLCFPLIP